MLRPEARWRVVGASAERAGSKCSSQLEHSFAAPRINALSTVIDDKSGGIAGRSLANNLHPLIKSFHPLRSGKESVLGVIGIHKAAKNRLDKVIHRHVLFRGAL